MILTRNPKAQAEETLRKAMHDIYALAGASAGDPLFDNSTMECVTAELRRASFDIMDILQRLKKKPYHL